MAGGLAQVQNGVGKEADRAAAAGPLLAELRAVLGWVEPALVHAVAVGAAVAPVGRVGGEGREGEASVQSRQR